MCVWELVNITVCIFINILLSLWDQYFSHTYFISVRRRPLTHSLLCSGRFSLRLVDHDLRRSVSTSTPTQGRKQISSSNRGIHGPVVMKPTAQTDSDWEITHPSLLAWSKGQHRSWALCAGGTEQYDIVLCGMLWSNDVSIGMKQRAGERGAGLKTTGSQLL